MNFKLNKEQIKYAITKLRKQIFFLLLIVDEKTKKEYENINVEEAFDNVLTNINGLNEILSYPNSLVSVILLLQSALNEYKKEDFSFKKYRKLILDAGNEVLNICKEG